VLDLKIVIFVAQMTGDPIFRLNGAKSILPIMFTINDCVN